MHKKGNYQSYQKSDTLYTKTGFSISIFRVAFMYHGTDNVAINRLEHEYQWVDFTYTVRQYKEFLSSIFTPLCN